MPRELDPDLQQRMDWMMEELTGEFGSSFDAARLRRW
jgi:hypothetical protein